MATRITHHIRPNLVLSAALLAALLVSALALAPRAEAFVYWAQPGFGLGRADLDGSDRNPDFITGVFGWDVAVDADHIYWADQTAVGRANLDGTDPNPDFMTGVGAYGVAVDANHIYWNDAIGDRIGRADLDGSNPDPGFITGVDAGDIAVDAGHIYWTAGGAIGRADLDGSNPDPTFIPGPLTGGPLWAIAVDADHIYWTAIFSDRIGRADLDGTGVDESFITGGVMRGIAVDPLTFPETTITSGPSGPTNDATPRFAFNSDHPGATFECRLDSTPLGFTACTSPTTYEDLPDGPHTFWVRATDPGSYADPSPASRKFTVDTSPPETKITNKRSKTTKTNPNYRFTSSDRSATFECKLDNRKWKPCESPETLKGLDRGKHVFKARAIDAAGNADPSPAKDKFKVIRKG